MPQAQSAMLRTGSEALAKGQARPPPGEQLKQGIKGLAGAGFSPL